MAKDLERIGRAERDVVLDLLREHYAAERLNLAEYQDRMAKAMVAKTARDLKLLLADLPNPEKQVAEKKGEGLPTYVVITLVILWAFIILTALIVR